MPAEITERKLRGPEVPWDRHIVSMHFYHNLAFVCKGENKEGSNILGKRFQ